MEVALDENAEEACGVLGCNCEVTNYSCDGAKLNVEGVISATVLCAVSKQNTTPDGEEVIEREIKPISTDFAFACSFDCPCASNADNICVFCDMLDIDASLQDDKLAVGATICIWANITQTSKTKFVTNIIEVKPREEKQCAMEILINQEEQDLWALCKNFGLCKEEVLAQNPNLEQVVQKGEKVIVYYKANAN